MKTSIELKEERGVLWTEAEAIEVESKENGLTEEQEARFDELVELVDELDGEILKAEKREALLAKAAKKNAKKDQRSGEERELDEHKNLDMSKVFRHILEGTKLDGKEAEVHQEGRNELREFKKSAKGFAFPSSLVNPEQRATIDQANSDIAPTEVGAYAHSLRENSVIQQCGITPMQLTGDYKIPIVGAQSLAWASAENSAAADGGAQFTSDTLTPFRLTGFVDFSEEILLQNGPGSLAEVMADLGRETANKIDTAFFSTASVTNAPPSLGAKSGIGTFTEASYTANESILSDLVSAEQTLAEAAGLSPNSRYVLATNLLSDLKKSAQVASVIPALEGGVGSQIVNGYPVNFTNACTKSAGTSGDGYFGDWNGAKFGFFGGMDMMVDPYSVNLNDEVRVVVHRHCDWGFPVAGRFVKFTSLVA